jgi:hypothetical protein
MSDFLLSAHPDPGWPLIEEGVDPARESEIEAELPQFFCLSRDDPAAAANPATIRLFCLRANPEGFYRNFRFPRAAVTYGLINWRS